MRRVPCRREVGSTAVAQIVCLCPGTLSRSKVVRNLAITRVHARFNFWQHAMTDRKIDQAKDNKQPKKLRCIGFKDLTNLGHITRLSL